MFIHVYMHNQQVKSWPIPDDHITYTRIDAHTYANMFSHIYIHFHMHVRI